MLHRYLRLMLLALVLICTTAAVPAIAGGLQSLPPDPLIGPSPTSVTAACVIEPYAPGANLNFWGVTDRWASLYQLVGPSGCPDCAGAPIQLNSIEFVSRTAGDPTCTYQVEVTVMGVIEGACPAPDETDILCPPTIVDVTVLSSTSAISVPLPAGCCITGEAYIRLRWIEDTTCGSGFLQPFLLGAADACAPCEQYFSTLVAFPAVTEMCSVTGNQWLRVNADCCGATPTHPHSWGKVKTLYR